MTVPNRTRGRIAVALALGVVSFAACSDDDASDAASGSRGGNTNYGEERIGFKQASAGSETAAGQGAAPAQQPGAAAPSDDAPALDNGDAPSEPDPIGVGGAPAITPEPEPIPVLMPTTSASDAGGTPPPPDAGRARVDAGLVMVDAGPGSSDAGAASSDAGTESSDAGTGAADAGAVAPFRLLTQPPGTALQPENPFRITETMTASTFSIDVDTGSYTLARAALNQGALPNPSTVRVEEFINYFHLHYAQPESDIPFSIYTEMSDCPWEPDHQLMMVGIQGQEVPLVDQPAANLVFLLDVSGSMNDPNKLPLLKKGFRMLTRQLRPIDTVSIVTYAGSDRVVLEGVSGDQKDTIIAALDQLQAGGSTNGEGGIQRAYSIAQQHYIEGGNNRVLLATDGDFNVGLSATEDLAEFIATKRDTGVFFSVYGFGSPLGNFQDANAEQLADNGNGVYFFIDGPEEARRAFIHTVTGSLLTVAKDVKLQVEFNPDQVNAYRLIGYENRVLNNADFSNDSVDAGELGAGLSVTAFFELIPAGSRINVPTPVPGTDPLDALEPSTTPTTEEPEFERVRGDDLVEVRIRYKGRDASVSELITDRYAEDDIWRGRSSLKFAFASAVAELAMQLRGSQYLPEVRTNELRDQIEAALPAEVDGAVREFLNLTTTAHQLSR